MRFGFWGFAIHEFRGYGDEVSRFRVSCFVVRGVGFGVSSGLGDSSYDVSGSGFEVRGFLFEISGSAFPGPGFSRFEVRVLWFTDFEV